MDSTDSGTDNPFRPGGGLSREADTIVNLIKEGKPITPTTPYRDFPEPVIGEVTSTRTAPSTERSPKVETPIKATNGLNKQLNAEPKGLRNDMNDMNGTSRGKSTPTGKEGEVEVKRVVVSPNEGAQPEQVVIKKQPKCRCCVVQ